MRVLVTNDDGIRAAGIATITRALAAAGHDVVVVAPAYNMSGMSAALGPVGMGEHIDVTHVDVCGIDGFAVEAPPALGVFAAAQGAFGEVPDMVVSGINAGLNTGSSVMHSGTVGAAMTASTLGIDAMAVSVDVSDPWHYETAAQVAMESLPWLFDNRTTGTVLNINVPAVPIDQVRGLKWAQLDLFGAVQTTGHDPEHGLMFELRSDEAPPVPGSDLALIEEGFATASVLIGISAIDPRNLKPIVRRRKVAPHAQPARLTADQDVITLEHQQRVLS